MFLNCYPLLKIGFLGMIVLAFTAISTSATAHTEQPTAASTADLKAGKKIFKKNCAICHGSKGNGKGMAAASLVPKPTNFTDSTIMTKVDLAFVQKVILEGGAANGKSPLMTPWKDILKADQIKNVAAYVWSLHQPKKNGN